MKANVYVTLRAGVLDPQGQAVHKTLAQLGFSEVRDVRIGKFVEIDLVDDIDDGDGDAATHEAVHEAVRAAVERMCQQLIANPVMEDYRIELIAAPESAG